MFDDLEKRELLTQVPSLQYLSERELSMLLHFVSTGNKAMAARAAAYGNGNQLSEARAGWAMFARPHVKQALSDVLSYLRGEVSSALALLIEGLWSDAHYDVRDAFDENGQLLPLHAMPDAIRMRITSYKMGRYGPEVTFVDKLRAKERLLDLFAAGNQPSGMVVNINFGEQPAEKDITPKEAIRAGQFKLNMGSDEKR